MADQESIEERMANFYRQSRAGMGGRVPAWDATAGLVRRQSWRMQVVASAAAAVFILGIAAGAYLLRQNQGRHAPNQAATTPSAAASPTAAPPPTPSAFTGSCTLPVSWGNPGMGSSIGGGFITFPGAFFAADPTASGQVTPFGAQWVSYDQPMHRWVPVSGQMLSPDGRTWLYGTLRNGNEYHAVKVETGRDTTLWGSDRLFRVIGLDNDSAYATLDGSSGARLWRIPLDGSPAVEYRVPGSWQFVNGGAAWGTPSAGLPAGAPYSLQRLDLKTNTVVTWVQLSGQGSLVGFDASGAPIIQVGGAGGEVIVAPSPGAQRAVAAAFTFARVPIDLSQLPALGDAHGIWLSGSDGIYLSVKGQASKQSSVQAFIAGPCS